MKNKTFIVIAFILIFLFAACAGKPATPTTVGTAASPSPVPPTATLDPCSETALPDEVAKVNDLMREFDDYSRLASSTLQEQLVQVIPSLQDVRRRAENQKVPQCLANLKSLQLAHMNTVIEILMVFMGNAQAEEVNPGIAQARDLHMKYDIEIARLLGVTLVPPPTVAPVTPAPTQP